MSRRWSLGQTEWATIALTKTAIATTAITRPSTPMPIPVVAWRRPESNRPTNGGCAERCRPTIPSTMAAMPTSSSGLKNTETMAQMRDQRAISFRGVGGAPAVPATPMAPAVPAAAMAPAVHAAPAMHAAPANPRRLPHSPHRQHPPHRQDRPARKPQEVPTQRSRRRRFVRPWSPFTPPRCSTVPLSHRPVTSARASRADARPDGPRGTASAWLVGARSA